MPEGEAENASRGWNGSMKKIEEAAKIYAAKCACTQILPYLGNVQKYKSYR